MEQGEDRWFVVVVHEQDRMIVLSRRAAGDRGKFSGPWGALTEDEATELATTWNADEREGGVAEVAEMYRYDRDPGWPESEA